MTVSKRLSTKRRNFLIAGAATIGAVVALWAIFSKTGNGNTYREVKPTRGSLELTIQATGTVQPENRLEIKSPIPGRMEKVLVREGQYVKKGEILLWMSSTERAALLDAARAKGEEELHRWEDLYKPSPILAPIDGMIILRNIEPGQSFSVWDAILVMSDRLTIKTQVDETDIAHIKVGQKAQFVLDAYSDEKLPATVDQVAFEAKTISNVTTYIVDVLPDKTYDFMRSGMTANVTFLVGKREDVVLLPTEIIKFSGSKTTVTVRGPVGEPAEKEIVLGATDGRSTEITKGLSETDVVLVPTNSNGRNRGSGGSNNPFGPNFRRPRGSH